MKKTKLILSLLFAILINVILGNVFAYASGLDAAVVVSVMLGISAVAMFVKPMQGVLQDVVITSAYAGEVLEQLLVRATTGNEIVAGGHIHLQPNVTKKFSIPRLKAGKMLQTRKEQPTEEDSNGTFTIDEKYLEPKDFMAFTTFNPRAFESIWRPFQTTGNLVFAELPPEIQSQLLAELAKVVDFELGDHYINGKYTANTEGKYFDGILTRIAADNDVVSIASPETLTESNILAKMKLVRRALPKAIRKNPNLKFFMSVRDAESYEYVLTNQPMKGVDYTNMNPERFKGIQVVSLADWPEDVIVAAVTSTGIDSNFWAGVALADDAEAIQIDKLTNAGEKYFFKMLMKADTNIVFGEDIVLYDGRAAAVAAGSADLAGLAVSAGALVPAFDAATVNYTVAVANAVATTTVTATHAQTGQVIKLGSTTLTSGVASASRNLAVGENIITVAVTSADGDATKTYTVLITRAAS
jgi:hypothetical protein